MKTKKCFLIFPFIIMGFALLFSGCSKKDDSTSIQPAGETVTDIDGNVYHTVTIGKQVWMVENLRTTKYRNGKPITPVSDSLQWSTLATEGYCNYRNDASKVSVYGHLYNWYAVIDTNKIAPAGWHVPADSEWTTLANYLGSGAGGKLKATGTTYWSSPNASATNSTGFTGLPGGDRSYTGEFHYMGTYGCFWCTTASSATNAPEHVLSCNSGNLLRLDISKGLGMSVRCIKD